MRKKLNLQYDILSDRRNEVASQFGLRFALPQKLVEVYQKLGADLARFNGENSWTLPMPARFVIDQQSIVRYASGDPDYTIRPAVEDTINALKELSMAGKR